MARKYKFVTKQDIINELDGIVSNLKQLSKTVASISNALEDQELKHVDDDALTYYAVVKSNLIYELRTKGFISEFKYVEGLDLVPDDCAVLSASSESIFATIEAPKEVDLDGLEEVLFLIADNTKATNEMIDFLSESDSLDLLTEAPQCLSNDEILLMILVAGTSEKGGIQC